MASDDPPRRKPQLSDLDEEHRPNLEGLLSFSTEDVARLAEEIHMDVIQAVDGGEEGTIQLRNIALGADQDIPMPEVYRWFKQCFDSEWSPGQDIREWKLEETQKTFSRRVANIRYLLRHTTATDNGHETYEKHTTNVLAATQQFFRMADDFYSLMNRAKKASTFQRKYNLSTIDTTKIDEVSIATFSVAVPNPSDKRKVQESSLQMLVRRLIERLSGEWFRRADGYYFDAVLAGNWQYKAYAYAPKFTIEQFVNEMTSPSRDYESFLWSTSPPNNFSQAVQILSDRRIVETPDLVEHKTFRSFAGDILGRGAGIYCCRSDMFFEYARNYDATPSWQATADDIRARRGLLEAREGAYDCVAPTPDDTCIIQIDDVFPFDVERETLQAFQSHEEPDGYFPSLWREGDAFECMEKHRIDAPALARAIAEAPSVSLKRGSSRMPLHDDSCWCFLSYDAQNPFLDTEVHELVLEPDLHRALLDETPRFGRAACQDERTRVVERMAGLSESTHRRLCAALDAVEDPVAQKLIHEGSVFVKSDDHSWILAPRIHHPMAPRRMLTRADYDAALEGVTPPQWTKYSWVEHEGRRFCIHSGRVWDECGAKEIDHIYACQDFAKYDRFFLYALKGRLFFEVGELDRHQMSFFIEGVGGCGKSTIITAQMAFFPVHVRGVLSSNVEVVFGMSEVLMQGKARVIFCNETAKDFKLRQEDWQTSVSGEVGSFPVKNGKPLRIKCTAQHMWVGNSAPLTFDNLQGQVSRRLAGVLMRNKVTPRDPSIMDSIMRKLGELLRKESLAYETFVEVTADRDPMSVVEELPPAFRHFTDRLECNTDTVKAFLRTDHVVLGDQMSHVCLLKDFHEAWKKWVEDNGYQKKPRWSDDVYANAFADNHIQTDRRDFTDTNGVVIHNAQIVLGVKLNDVV